MSSSGSVNHGTGISTMDEEDGRGGALLLLINKETDALIKGWK